MERTRESGRLTVAGFGAEGDVIAFEPGRFNVVLGRNGAGKTALCRLVAGLDEPGTARVQLTDRELTGVPTRRRSVGLVFGEFVNYPGLTVEENIALPLRAAGLGRDAVRERVEDAARSTGLAALLDRYSTLLAQFEGS